MRSRAAATAATEEAEHAELARALLTLRTWALRCKPARPHVCCVWRLQPSTTHAAVPLLSGTSGARGWLLS
jgi:hypothetical protein